jgi:hypothetical protein
MVTFITLTPIAMHGRRAFCGSFFLFTAAAEDAEKFILLN